MPESARTRAKPKVLLTGGRGLIGQYVLQHLLESGLDVYAVTRKRGGSEATVPGVRWLVGDLLDPVDRREVCERVGAEYLLHLAWDTRNGKYLESDLNFSWHGASLEMLQSFVRHGGKKAVFVGSCFEYGFSAAPLREDSPIAPQSLYAKCKHSLNRLAAHYCRNNGVPFGWGRIFYVYGKNEQAGRLTAQILEAVKKKIPVTIKSGPLVRDYMYAGDIAGALVKFLLGPVEGEVNICSGTGIRLEEYCRRLARLAGGEEWLRFEDDAGGQPPVIVGDAGRLRSEVGFVPRYDFESGFSKILGELA